MSTPINIAAAMAGAHVQPRERTIEVITEEIIAQKDRVGAGILEIGRGLIEAKEKLSHGEWLPWLNNRVEISERMAQNFMRLAREYPNPQPVADLGARKALALLELPASEREAFMAGEHVVNGEVKQSSELTARELEQAIRDRKAALEAKERAEAAAKAAEDARAKMEQEMALAKARLDAAALDEARAEGAAAARKEAEDALQAKLDKATTAEKEAREKLRELREAAKQTEKTLAEQNRALSEKVDGLEKKLRVAGGKELATFSVYFEAVQEDYNRCLGCLQMLSKNGDGNNHDKLLTALETMLASLRDRLPAKKEAQKNAD
ncbi:DUF3102 domain-containing protein [Lawsonibacter faecis]|uniref:DUF3102 domain-containing protein n=1 Tax=Lawsonibacter faecis TaxID=2763052 RepID=A0A8J6M767_9FIRM|nr:DUF3102 domain-containing protein [Lawsonibacter faecis]MBC5736097.1 DUF3102 domain-containing protein [Lawsonibacter faecis]